MLTKNIPNPPPSIPAPNSSAPPQKAIEHFHTLTMVEQKKRYCQVLAISKFFFISLFYCLYEWEILPT